MWAADLFLALENAFDVYRQSTLSLQVGLQSFDMREELAFVVRRSAAIHGPAAHGRTKRWNSPFACIFCRLYVVMTVNQYRRITTTPHPLSINYRMSLGRDSHNFVYSD